MSGQGPAGPDDRRRNSRGWWRSPGPWVAAAVVLVVVGAAVSPQGEPLEPRPPDTAWAVSVEPGRAPGVWVLGDRPVVAAADGLTAYDPTTGDEAWTVPLADPACTAAEAALTCVHGEGEDASIATIDAAGDVTELPFPDADVAVSAADDVIVAGGTGSESPWFGRFTTTSPREAIWQHQLDDAETYERRWQEATLSQGIVTVNTGPDEDSRPRREPGFGLAADAATGTPRPAVVRSPRGTATNHPALFTEEWDQIVLPLPAPEPAVPGYPEAVFSSRGAFDSYGGERILEYLGEPLAAVGGDVVTTRLQRESLETPTPAPGAEVEVATLTERLDVRTGEPQWQLDRSQLLGCPCATSPDTIVVTGSSATVDERLTISPQALLGIGLETGRHHWTLPIKTYPDAVAAGRGQVYLLSGGTLTAYADR